MTASIPSLPLLLLSPLTLSLAPAAPPQEPGEGSDAGGAPITLTLEVDQIVPGEGASSVGVVNWMGLDRALDMYNQAGGTGGAYRRNLRLNSPDSVQMRDDLLTADGKGFTTWLTVMGTPDDLASTTTGLEFDTGLPPGARSMPTDPGAWTDRLIAELTDLQAETGILPDYIEIWNEPDRPEFFSGTLQDYLTLYTYAAEGIRGAFPGIRVGGMGVAIASATLGGTDPALEELARHAALNQLPLDFLSWHHYEFTNSLALDHTARELRTLTQTLGLGSVEMVVSEWNIHPGTTHFALDFDRAEAAANLAGFLTTALDEEVDRSLFFQLVDVFGETGSPDLQGGGMGSLTTHGIKKPSFLVLETILPMLAEDRVRTTSEVNELGVRALATRSGNRVRVVLSNVPVNTDWLLEERTQAIGYSSADFLAMVSPAFEAAPSEPPTVDELVAAGLDLQLATDALEIYKEFKSARASRWAPRNVELKVRHLGGSFTIGEVTRFDDDHNDLSSASAGRLDSYLAGAADKATRLTLEEMADYLTSIGYPTTYQELAAQSDLMAWGASNGVPLAQMESLGRMYTDRLMDNKLASEVELNDLPFLRVTSETAEGSGVIQAGGLVTLTLQPHSVMILDINLD